MKWQHKHDTKGKKERYLRKMSVLFTTKDPYEIDDEEWRDDVTMWHSVRSTPLGVDKTRSGRIRPH